MTEPRRQQPRWEDPPERTGQYNGKWKALLTPLMASPGRWAWITDDVSGSTVSSLRHRNSHSRGRQVKPPPGRWEFRFTPNADNKLRGTLHARYLGE